MGLFRKKPVEIEAVQYLGPQSKMASAIAFDGVAPDWLDRAFNKPQSETGAVFRFGDHLLIQTLEGSLMAQPGDWIIQGVKGELYPCKPDIFAATYDLVAV